MFQFESTSNRRRAIAWTSALLTLVTLLSGAVKSRAAEEAEPEKAPAKEVRKPLGPDELPEFLPGRWKVSLCVSVKPAHAWIRYENVETHEIRSVSRFHLLVGAWFDEENFRWHYPPTTRTGVYMDREQSIEVKYPREQWLFLSTYVDNPRIYKGENGGHGHGMAVNNCVTYSRDAWYQYTGEYYKLHRIHDPEELRRAILRHHPEVVREKPEADNLAPVAAR